MVKTYLGRDIADDIRGVLYLCTYHYDNGTLEVTDELLFTDSFQALNAYAEIPNPASQLARGNTREEFEKSLKQLHDNLDDPTWVYELANYL